MRQQLIGCLFKTEGYFRRMKPTIINLVGAIIIAASILLGFGMLWDQREKQHKEEIKELKDLSFLIDAVSRHISQELEVLILQVKQNRPMSKEKLQFYENVPIIDPREQLKHKRRDTFRRRQP